VPTVPAELPLTTWDAEGSRTRRSVMTLLSSGITTGGIAPGRITVRSSLTGSGAETGAARQAHPSRAGRHHRPASAWPAVTRHATGLGVVSDTIRAGRDRESDCRRPPHGARKRLSSLGPDSPLLRGSRYFTTWGTEGSRTRRPLGARELGGITVGGVVPDHRVHVPRGVGSGAETAFLATLGQVNARAAQRRPSAGHLS
jgi:hypothetical protein